MSGRSTKTFMEEGRLEDIVDNLKFGDYLLIQFGHNDCDESHPERVVSLEAYGENLRKFVLSARERGAEPILATPITDLKLQSGIANLNLYSDVVHEVAAELNVPILDMRKYSRLSLEKLGSRRSAEFFQPDGVHLTQAGAEHMANIAVYLIKNSGDKRLSFLKSVFGG